MPHEPELHLSSLHSAADTPAKAESQAPLPATSSLREANPFASSKSSPPSLQDRSAAAATEPYSVRLPTDLKRRLAEAVAREGGRAAPLLEALLESYEEKRRAGEQDIAEKFRVVKRNVEGHLRGLLVTLGADLRDLAAADDLLEAEVEDALAQGLKDRDVRQALERELAETRERLVIEKSHRAEERKLAQEAEAAAKAELREAKDALRTLHASLSEAQARLAEASGARERTTKLEARLGEAEQRLARADLHREEAELKLARVTEDLARTRRALDENEILRIRQHETAEDERKALHSRAAAEKDRLEATVERLQARIAEMTREANK